MVPIIRALMTETEIPFSGFPFCGVGANFVGSPVTNGKMGTQALNTINRIWRSSATSCKMWPQPAYAPVCSFWFYFFQQLFNI